MATQKATDRQHVTFLWDYANSQGPTLVMLTEFFRPRHHRPIIQAHAAPIPSQPVVRTTAAI
jgi:hypothetical protein